MSAIIVYNSCDQLSIKFERKRFEYAFRNEDSSMFIGRIALFGSINTRVEIHR